MGCLALSFPRFALFLVWLLGGNYLERAFGSALVLLLGFVFLPLTTLAYAFSYHSLSLAYSHHLTPLGSLVVLLALLIDIGLIGGSNKQAQRWRRERG
jgi:hypothetical protein